MRTIGSRKVSPIGLGAAGLSVGNPPPDDVGVEMLITAFDAGITLVDTAACYVPSHLQQGHNEGLIAQALKKWGGDRDQVVVATKGGLTRTNTVAFEQDFTGDGRPESIVAHCENSLVALGVDCIDLYFLHTPDPTVPWLDSVGAFRTLVDQGKIAMAGFSSVSAEQIEAARAVVDVAAVQNEFSPGKRHHRDVLDYCGREGIAFLAYSPLGGLGQRAGDMPVQNPAFAEIAAARGVSPHQVALAWELGLSDAVIPIPGARRRETILDSAKAMDLRLTPDEMEALRA